MLLPYFFKRPSLLQSLRIRCHNLLTGELRGFQNYGASGGRGVKEVGGGLGSSNDFSK